MERGGDGDGEGENRILGEGFGRQELSTDFWDSAYFGDYIDCVSVYVEACASGSGWGGRNYIQEGSELC